MTLWYKNHTNHKILIYHPDPWVRNDLAHSLGRAGFPSIFKEGNSSRIMSKIEDRALTHIFMCPFDKELPGSTLIQQALLKDPELNLIILTERTTVDQVFDLLKAGAKGFLLLPIDDLTLVETMAVIGESKQIPDFILDAKDRNSAFARLVSDRLDSLALVMRQAPLSRSPEKMLEEAAKKLKESIDLSESFREGELDDLATAYLTHFEDAANGPASRLGKLRRASGKRREKKT